MCVKSPNRGCRESRSVKHNTTSEVQCLHWSHDYLSDNFLPSPIQPILVTDTRFDTYPPGSLSEETESDLLRAHWIMGPPFVDLKSLATTINVCEGCCVANQLTNLIYITFVPISPLPRFPVSFVQTGLRLFGFLF